jgi:HlyD family type I secretion membrane fusion protein
MDGGKMSRFGPPKPIVRRDVLFGIIVIIIFFGILGFWAGFAPLETAAIAPGKIIVSGYQKEIQHLEGGIVKKIFVKDGDTVKQGQMLITLQPTQAKSSLGVIQNQLNENKSALVRIQAELDGKKILPKISNKAINKQEFDIQQSIFKTNQRVFTDTVSIYNERIKQLQHQIAGVKAKITANKQQLFYINKELIDVRALAKKRLVKQSRLLALEREAARIKGTQAEYDTQIAQLQQKIGETRIEITKFMSDHRQKLLTELKETHQKINDFSEQETVQKDIVNRTTLRSPIAGTVVGLQVHTNSAVIQPGEVLMNIVPKHEAMIAEVRLNPLDIDVVHQGLKAQIRIAAFNQRTAPLLEGTVIHVSADALSDQATGQIYYLAQINIPKSQLSRLPAKDKLYPGMPVEAMIVVNRLTPWSYFVAPVQRSFNRAFREE